MFLSSSPSPISANRIISLVPSQTELLYDLGLRDEVVGITKFCIHPNEWYRSKTRVGGTKDVDLEVIKSLNPTLIIANKEENVKPQIETLGQHIPVWLTDVNNLNDAVSMIHDIGTLINKQEEATILAQKIITEFSNQQAATAALVPACYLIWKDPYMTVGSDSFISSMMEHAGFSNVFSYTTRYPSVTVAEIEESGCEVLLLSSEPYPFKEKHLQELIAVLPGIKILLVDGEMFSWYGSRMLLAPAYFKSLRETLANTNPW